MNILRIADVPNNRTGGMTRYIHGATDELVRAGHHVDLLFSDSLKGGRGGRWRRFTVPLLAVREVLRRMKTGIRYDVVEIHEPIAAAYAVRRRLDRSLPPLLVSVYALEARAHAARLGYARAAGRPVSWKAKVAPLSVVWQANLALRWADHVLVETTEDREYLTRQLFVPPERVSLQPGGVGEAFFTPPTAARTGVLFLGTWIERKGTREFVQGVTAVLAERPDLRVTVAGCGCPAERVLSDFPEPLRGRVRVIPSVVGDEPLAALYRDHAVFAFPSTFEGLPLVLLEAAAAGLAIVTTRTCGMKDVIADGRSGLLVDVGDAAGFTAALRRLADGPELCERLGAAARATARGYTWARSAEQFLAAATAAAGRGRGTR